MRGALFCICLLLVAMPGCAVRRDRPLFTPTPSQFAHGEAQLEKMLGDRPAMAPYVRKGDGLWNWTVRQFAGEYAGGGVHWDPTDPVPLWNAMFYGEWKGVKAHIKVTQNHTLKNYHFGEPKTGPVLWYETIFELHNFRTLPRLMALWKRALEGGIDREGYIRECSLIEWDTMKGAHDFFNEVWIPHCRKLSLPAEDEFSRGLYGEGIKVPSKEEVLRHYGQKGDFHNDYYGALYDSALASRTPTPAIPER